MTSTNPTSWLPVSGRKLVCWAVLLFAAGGQLALEAQQVLGAITGTVKDASGAAVPDASVKAVSKTTNLSVSGKTEANGSYLIPNLPAGAYQLSITKQGFQTETHTEVIVNSDRTTTIDGNLRVGAVATTVEVTAVALMNQVDTTNGYVVNQSTIEQTPLATGSFTQLAILSPGVHADFVSGGGANTGSGQPGDYRQRTARHQQQLFAERHQHQQPVQRQLRQPGGRESLRAEYGREFRRGRLDPERLGVQRHRPGAAHAARGSHPGNLR